MFITIMIKTDVYHVLEAIFISIYIYIDKENMFIKQINKKDACIVICNYVKV